MPVHRTERPPVPLCAKFALAACLLLCSNAVIAQPATESDIPLLQLNQPITEQLRGNKPLTYGLRLEAGQMMRGVVEQQGVNVEIIIREPDGKTIARFDRVHRRLGFEPIALIARTSGVHRLTIRPLTKQDGSFRLEVVELRIATPGDEASVADEGSAARALREAEQLLPGTPESRGLALQKLQKALPMVSPGDHAGEAMILRTIGEIHSLSGDKRQALEYYQRARLVSQASGDQAGEALALSKIGEVTSSLGNKLEAIAFFEQSLPLFRAVRRPAAESHSLRLMGQIYESLGETQRALDCYGLALAAARTANKARAEALVLFDIGSLYASLEETARAADHYNQALRSFRALGDRYSQAAVLSDLGTAQRLAGNLQLALDYYTQAIALWKIVGSQLSQATELNNIGLIYDARGEQQKALEYYAQALSIRRVVGDPRRIALALDRLGQTHDSMGEREKALTFYAEALSMWDAGADATGRAITLRNIGTLYTHAKDWPRAIGFYEQALTFWQTVKNRDGEAFTLFLIAIAERDRGEFDSARRRIESTLAIVEGLRTSIVDPDLRSSYFAHVQRYYEFYVSLLMRLHAETPTMGHDVAALRVSERARARSLLDLLQEDRKNLKQSGDPQLLEREKELLEQLNTRVAQEARATGDAKATAQMKALSEEIDRLSNEYRGVQSQIKKSNPRYAELAKTELPALADVQKLLDPQTLLLEYKLGSEGSYLWLVASDRIESYELPARKEIETTTKQAYQLLIERNRRTDHETTAQQKSRLTLSDQQLQKAATQLSQTLLGPIARQLGSKRLVIVADGALQLFPFAALPGPKTGEPLVSTNEIVNLPSIAVLPQLRRDRGTPTATGKSIAVFADPVFEPDDPRLAAARALITKRTGSPRPTLRDFELEAGSNALSRLPASREEAKVIVGFAPANTFLNALDFRASRERAVSAEIGQYRVLHFATHSILNTVRPELSGIVLSLYDDKGNERDGFLRLNQIYNLNLSNDLVVLSACRTALGKEVKGEGLIGLTRGFMYAGVPRVIASLWKVDDEATSELMKLFYQNLLQRKMSASQALRSAQVDMQKQPRWNSPYYWGAFVLQGDWR
jgi:CHAT domain-containing protein